MGGAICGIIVAADNFGNVNVIIAEVILTQIGSFMIYYSLVSFYNYTYDISFSRVLANFSAKYYGFWQGEVAKLVRTIQHFSFYVLVALAIASGAEGSNYDSTSSVALAQNLSKAYSIIC